MAFLDNARMPVGSDGVKILERMNRSHAEMAAWGLSHIEIDKDADCLDIGCGGGANLRRLAELCPDGSVSGMDYSQTSVEESKKNAADLIEQGRCRVVLGDVSNIPFADDSFDVVTAFETVYFWPDIEESFRQVLRVLRTGGTFLICNEMDGLDPQQYSYEEKVAGLKLYKADELTELIKKAGFIDARSDGNAEEHWTCVLAKKDNSRRPLPGDALTARSSLARCRASR